MFDHIGINVGSVPTSKAFYEPLLASLGYSIRMQFPEHELYAFGRHAPTFWLAPGRDPSRKSAVMHLAFSAVNRAQVDAFYAAGLKAGGQDNGTPGVRADYHRWYYGAYLLDPDGNNVECVCHYPPALIYAKSLPAIVGYVGMERVLVC